MNPSEYAGLLHHLQYNHFPPLPESMVAVAQWAIERASAAGMVLAEDEIEWDETILEESRAMPDGIEFQDKTTITVSEAIESMHLDQAVDAALMTEYERAYCPECKCLWDNHQQPEDVDDGIPFARAASGETDPSQIVTCGDCAACYAVPPKQEEVPA